MAAIEDVIADLMLTWPCCVLATAYINELQERERLFFSEFMPQAKTALVIGHHITTEDEWTWFATDDDSERCDADDHTREVCIRLGDELARSGFQTRVVPYPQESGLQFRFVAEAAGVGEIGSNAFLFHPAWGSWVHLRVMGTTASLRIRPSAAGDQLCDQCLLCVSECPAGAIAEDSFNGLQCRSFRKALGEYVPVGPEREFRYCKICANVCPKGARPRAG
jgi:epoxyqueuosine reductase QueG